MGRYPHFEGLGSIGASTLVLTLTVLMPVYSCPSDSVSQPKQPDLPAADSASTDNQLPEITQTSGESEIQLAQHLKAQGAKLYGAYWCPHCHEQHELFGAEAFEYLPYIECAPDGKASQATHCQTLYRKTEATTGQVFGFPTWVINGKVYGGSQSLEDLAKYSGYQGPSEFKNDVPDSSGFPPSLDDFFKELLSPNEEVEARSQNARAGLG